MLQERVWRFLLVTTSISDYFQGNCWPLVLMVRPWLINFSFIVNVMRQWFVWIGFYFSLSRRGPDNMEAKFFRYWSDMEGYEDVTVRHLTCLNEQFQSHSLKAEDCKKVKRKTKGCRTDFSYFSCLMFVKLNYTTISTIYSGSECQIWVYAFSFEILVLK